MAAEKASPAAAPRTHAVLPRTMHKVPSDRKNSAAVCCQRVCEEMLHAQVPTA